LIGLKIKKKHLFFKPITVDLILQILPCSFVSKHRSFKHMFSVKSIRGKREYMEDRYAFHTFKNGVMVGMVSDGHAGSKVTEHLSANLPFLLSNSIRRTTDATAKSIYNIIYAYAKTFVSDRSGSTLTGFVATASIVYIFNIGDSRTCFHFKKSGSSVSVSGKVSPASCFWCTTDHTDKNPAEVARVMAAGGKISDGRLNGILAMTRSVGDASVGVGLSCEPDVSWVRRKDINGLILMYSDGVYEGVKESPHAIYHLAVDSGLEAVVTHATKSGSQDNITAVLVKI